MKKITKLVISGGGSKGYAMLGVLQYLYEQHILDDIQECWGTSIGSILSLLFIAGFEPFHIFFELNKTDGLFNTRDVPIHNILSGVGLVPIDIFGKRVIDFFHKKFPEVETFSQLYEKTKKKLHVIGTNLTTLSQEVFSIDTTPSMKLIDAIEISCNLPFIFTRKVFNDNMYVDGGFTNNYPVDHADKGDELVLGIYIQGTRKPNTTADMSVLHWMTKLWTIPMYEIQTLKVNHTSPLVIHIPISLPYMTDLEFASMNMDTKKKMEIYKDGYEQAMRFCKRNYYLVDFVVHE